MADCKMTHMFLLAFCLLFCDFCDTLFVIPEVKLEAFSPKGFRASIPHSPGIQLFAFHGRLNKKLSNVEPGEFSHELLSPVDGFWLYYDPNIEIHVGDKLYYWVFVQHERLGYRKDVEVWNVQDLITEKTLECEHSLTTINDGQIVCKGSVIFDEHFNTLDKNKWTIQNYIPLSGPNFEFNSYENDPDTVMIKQSKLVIKPSVARDIRGVLDLRKGCTSRIADECYHQQIAASFVPPIKSGKITSTFSFKYGRIDVRAKLPAGDWIFPEICLTPKDGSKEIKLWIAYTRGNERLIGLDGSDIGSGLLFGGPVLASNEPVRSSQVSSRRNPVPYYNEEHVYSVDWRPGSITLLIDGQEYGKTFNTRGYNNQNKKDAPFDTEFTITLGVGVGGINDFPNDFKSGTVDKPWRNKDRRQVMNFYNSINIWEDTWKDDKPSLIVDSIVVHSLQ